MSDSTRHVTNRILLRARDTMDRDYPRPLDVEALASAACLSRAHFIRSFRGAFGETPHRYLQRRRIERAMALLRNAESAASGVQSAVRHHQHPRSRSDSISNSSMRRRADALRMAGARQRAGERGGRVASVFVVA